MLGTAVAQRWLVVTDGRAAGGHGQSSKERKKAAGGAERLVASLNDGSY